MDAVGESGRKRKLGFGRKEKNAFTVHRSEEVIPTVLRHLVRQDSSLSSSDGLVGTGGGVVSVALPVPVSAAAAAGPSRSSSSRSLMASHSLSVDLNDCDESQDLDGYDSNEVKRLKTRNPDLILRTSTSGGWSTTSTPSFPGLV